MHVKRAKVNGSPGAGVARDCEPPDRFWELSLGPVKEEYRHEC